jgi:hypothetical protein
MRKLEIGRKIIGNFFGSHYTRIWVLFTKSLIYISSVSFRLIWILIHLVWKSTRKNFKHHYRAMHAFVCFHHIMVSIRLSTQTVLHIVLMGLHSKRSCCMVLMGLQPKLSYTWCQWDSPKWSWFSVSCSHFHFMYMLCAFLPSNHNVQAFTH